MLRLAGLLVGLPIDSPGGDHMALLSEEEQRRLMESPPTGTLVIILIYGAIFMVAWLALYFVRFLGHGPVN